MLAITHCVSPNMNRCLSQGGEGETIQIPLAQQQHAAYCKALESLGYRVKTLDVNRELPDCVFVEDTAVVLDEVAILCSMGHTARRAEPAGIEPVLRELRDVERVELPATLEGGDVLRIGHRLLVGLSQRTNAAGAEALARIAGRHGYRVTAVEVRGCLHLKSAATALPDGRLLANTDWLDVRALDDLPIVRVPAQEPGAANVLAVGQHLLASAAYPATRAMIEAIGFGVTALDMSEFAKADGCVTCLSLLL